MNDRDLNVSEQCDAIEKGIEKALKEIDPEREEPGKVLRETKISNIPFMFEIIMVYCNQDFHLKLTS